METLSTINFLMAAVFAACYCYQVVFAVARLLKKRRRFTAQKLCRYAVLIAARNESAVIAQLLESIRGQNYPQDLVHIYVVADNCTDNTAQIAAACGARVFQRQNKLQVGKGFALRFLLQKIQEEYPQERYDGYFVFDADNLLDPRYITEMNKVFSSGNRVVTSYRNTKNYGDNWITAGYGLWFLRESEYLNRPRDYLGTSCAVSGTGFLFAHSLLEELGGWDYFLLTEDLEFTADLVCRGEKIAYCHDAVIYDEQPSSFAQSIRQRSRWQRGYLQVVAKHGGNMVKTMLCDGSFACFDMLMCTIPAVVLSVISLLLNGVMFVVGVTIARKQLDIFFASVIMSAVNSYLVMLLMGLLPLVTEWRRIRCSRGRRLATCSPSRFSCSPLASPWCWRCSATSSGSPLSTAWPSPLGIWAASPPRSCGKSARGASCKAHLAEMFHIPRRELCKSARTRKLSRKRFIKPAPCVTMVCTQGAFLSIRKERRKGAVIFAAAGWPPGYVRGLPRALLAAKGKGGVCSLPADAAAYLFTFRNLFAQHKLEKGRNAWSHGYLLRKNRDLTSRPSRCWRT